MNTDPRDPAHGVYAPGQSLSPFESRTTTMVVWWSLLVLASTVLVVCWALWL